MRSLSSIHEKVTNYGELEQAVASLEKEVSRMKSAESVSSEEIQSAGTCITQLRLLMNELERNEVRRSGASRELAGKQVELAVAFRALRADLDRIMTRVGA